MGTKSIHLLFYCVAFMFMMMHVLHMNIAFDLQSVYISNYYEFYLLRTQPEHNENASSSTVTENYTE